LWAEVTRAPKPAEAPEVTAISDLVADEGRHGRDPYEELTRLAAVHAIAHTMPRREEDRPASAEVAIAEVAIAEAAIAEATDTPATTGEPDHPNQEETPWPIGERRSAARQARKPLPAVLQAAVASGVTNTGAEASAPPHADARQTTGAAEGPKTESDIAAGSGKPPSLFRRYGSAMVVVALFIAAGGAAIGIAWARGPVGQKVSPTPAQDQAAANKVVLGAGDFPPGWHFSRSGTAASSYGVGAMFVTPSVVNSWLVGRPQCVSALNDLRNAMTPAAGGRTALASSQATAPDGRGGSWQIADTVSFHVTSTQVAEQGAAMSTLLASPHSMACISSFWRSGLLAALPRGSHVVTSVTRLPVPTLPGNPSVWAISMTSTAAVGHRALPIQFEFTTFTSGRTQVSLASSGKFVPLNDRLDRSLLTMLASRTERFAS